MDRRIFMPSTVILRVNIVTGQLNGELPKRALAHVQEWRLLHQSELLEAWALAQAQKSLPKIDPLE